MNTNGSENPANTSNPESAKQLSFEDALFELEANVRDLEAGDISLEDGLGRFERAIGLLKQCKLLLGQADQRVLLLSGADGDGRPVTQPFEHPAPVDPARIDPRRRPRKDESSY